MKKIDLSISMPILGGICLLLGAAFNWAAKPVILLLAALLFALFTVALVRFSRICALEEETEQLRAQLDEEKAQHRRALKEMEERHEKQRTELIAELSNSLRIPLATVQGYAELIRLGTLDPVTEADYIEKIAEGTFEMEDVLAAQLGAAREERAPAHKAVELIAFAHRQAENIRRDAARCGAAVQVLSSEETLTAAVDAHQLGRIFTQLFQNALTYMGREGRITVRGGREGDFARVCVRDDGLGLA